MWGAWPGGRTWAVSCRASWCTVCSCSRGEAGLADGSATSTASRGRGRGEVADGHRTGHLDLLPADRAAARDQATAARGLAAAAPRAGPAPARVTPQPARPPPGDDEPPRLSGPTLQRSRRHGTPY